MEATNYTSIGPVLHINKAGELAQKRMKAVKVCDGLYITEPDRTQFVKLVIEYNGVMWVEHQAAAANVIPSNMAKRMPAILASIKGGKLNEMNDYHKELHRRIFNPEAPAIMEIKTPERKKPEPLPEGAKKVSVMMFKGCTDEVTDKKVIITEVAPHVYTYAYKLKRYGERVKIIFEIDGVYFQGNDNDAYIMEREDFTEVCTKAYANARANIADGAAKGMPFFVELQKRINAGGKGIEIAELPEDINYMFYIRLKGEDKFCTYNPGQGTCKTGRVFTELYRKEQIKKVCDWIMEDKSGGYAYQLRSGDGKKVYWEHNPQTATPTETPEISTQAAEPTNVSAEAKEDEKTQINDKTRQYIISTYKTKENLVGKFSDTISSIVAQLEEYRTNKRKGGNKRKEHIKRMEEQIKLLYAQMQEWSALFDAPQPPETTIPHNPTNREKRHEKSQNQLLRKTYKLGNTGNTT